MYRGAYNTHMVECGSRLRFLIGRTCSLVGALFVLLLSATRIAAQDITPEATLDKDRILIGQQTQLVLSVMYPAASGTVPVVGWPTVSDTLTGKIDVVRESGVDTLPPNAQNGQATIKLTRTLSITSWDSGYWAVPPFVFTINGDTVETKPMLLTVNTVEVDTSATTIRDIKEIYDVPYGWKDWVRDNWHWLAGGAVVAGLLAWGTMWYVRRRRTPKSVVAVAEPAKPLHVRTLLALEEVDKKKLWQQGLVKDYHSAVTDILRGYIEDRFQVPALESTTDDLLGILRMSSMGAAQREQLANLLRMADMVKFAKWTPLPAENEQMMAGAVKLVQQTTEALSDAPKP